MQIWKWNQVCGPNFVGKKKKNPHGHVILLGQSSNIKILCCKQIEQLVELKSKYKF